MTRIRAGEIKYIVSSTSPSGYSQRTLDTPWVDTPMEDREIAREAVLAERERVINEKEERARAVVSNPGFRAGALITRSDANQAIAAKLGLSADELADRLARPDVNQGTRARLTEEEFDAEMSKLGLSPEEARARFKGTFWD